MRTLFLATLAALCALSNADPLPNLAPSPKTALRATLGARQAVSTPPAWSQYSADFAYRFKSKTWVAVAMANAGQLTGIQWSKGRKIKIDLFALAGVDTTPGKTNGFAVGGAAIAKTVKIADQLDLKGGFGVTWEKSMAPEPTLILGVSWHLAG